MKPTLAYIFPFYIVDTNTKHLLSAYYLLLVRKNLKWPKLCYTYVELTVTGIRPNKR